MERTRHDIFDSAVRSAGDLAGVFEDDGQTGYFYLYEVKGRESGKVLDAIHIYSGATDLAPSDIKLLWNEPEECVGLFIRRVLWAVFDVVLNQKYGGNYVPGSEPMMPVTQRFAPRDI